MLRALRFLAILAVLVWLALWLADQPGSVILNWRGYRLDTSFALMLVAVGVIAIIVALVYRLWINILGLPSRIIRSRREKRRRRGYLALTRGMVAVAAGDPDDASRQVKRAEGLLGEPPLTMLLSAQAAQLADNETAAGKHFSAMLDNPETEFLGLRGLLNQAMKRDDWREALKLARRAYRIRPKSRWVASTLFDMLTRAGHWAEAEATLTESVKHHLVGHTDGHGRQAALKFQRSLEAREQGNNAEAVRCASQAHDMDPGFIPAAVIKARFLVDSGKMRKAASLIELAWQLQPHPDFVHVYWAAKGANDAAQKFQATQHLAGLKPDHPESSIAVAAAALEARMWDKAREYLQPLLASGGSVRACRLMAELEESEHGDPARGREWLMRASHADPNPAWVCNHCGNAVAEWSALCGKCGNFDSFAWRAPAHIVSLTSEEAEMPVALTARTNE